MCIDKLGNTKIINGLCFDDFRNILDIANNLDSNNYVMNKGPCASLNIYKSDINLEEAIK